MVRFIEQQDRSFWRSAGHFTDVRLEKQFPSISTGVYSFPVELAAKIAVHTVNRFLQDNPDCFDLVEWVLFDTNTESVYEAEVDKLYEEYRLCQKN